MSNLRKTRFTKKKLPTDNKQKMLQLKKHGDKQNKGRDEQQKPHQSRQSHLGTNRNEFSRYRQAIGFHACREALKMWPKRIKVIFLKQGWESSQDLREMEEMARAERISVQNQPEAFFDRLGSGHQGVSVLVNGGPVFDAKQITQLDKAVILFLDGIVDPHNLGAIMRTSWLLGVSVIVIPHDRAVGLTPTVHKVACGGVEHVPVVFINQFNNLIDEFKQAGFWVFGLAGGEKQNLFNLRIPPKVVWIIGAEEKGLRVSTSRQCDELIAIPQINVDASYNASVATGMALSETFRQHFFEK